MPKPFLHRDDALLEDLLIETMLAGLKEWRPDLAYPESHSDLQGCVRALLRRFEIKQRPLDVPLRLRCPKCDGIGVEKLLIEVGARESHDCKRCGGQKFIREGS